MLKKVGDIGKQGSLIYSMKSDSTDEIYEIRTIEGSTDNFCTCLGYMSSKRRPKICKHIRRYFLIQMLKTIAERGFWKADVEELWAEKAKAVERLFKKEV